MGMIEQRLIAVVASYKLKFGLPFSATQILPKQLSTTLSHGIDLPVITETDGDSQDNDQEIESGAGSPGQPASIGEIRAQVGHTQRVKWGNNTQRMNKPGNKQVRHHPSPGASSRSLPPPT